jgi:predicted fused transcriptional regulator/phosphomethylpyrimidine kinase
MRLIKDSKFGMQRKFTPDPEPKSQDAKPGVWRSEMWAQEVKKIPDLVFGSATLGITASIKV